jgi:hypothetical protein
MGEKEYMVKLEDIKILPPFPGCHEIAIDYAGRSIYYTYDRMQYANRLYNRLIRIVAGILVENCIEGYFNSVGCKFSRKGRTHWRKKDVSEFIINGKRIDIKSYHVYPSPDRKFPEWFLDTEALVPCDQLQGKKTADVYLHAFVVAPQYNKGNDHKWIAAIPPPFCDKWELPQSPTIEIQRRASADASFFFAGEISNYSDGSANSVKDANIEVMLADMCQSETTPSALISLQYVHSIIRPSRPIVLRFSAKYHIINPGEWYDLLLDEPVVYLAGWGFKEDFWEGTEIPKGTKTRVYTNGTRTTNKGVFIRNLRPIADLIGR